MQKLCIESYNPTVSSRVGSSCKYGATVPQEHRSHLRCLKLCNTRCLPKISRISRMQICNSGQCTVIKLTTPRSAVRKHIPRGDGDMQGYTHSAWVRPTAFCRAGNTVGLYAKSARANTRLENVVVWEVMACGLVYRYGRFGGTCWLHLRRRNVGISSSSSPPPCS